MKAKKCLFLYPVSSSFVSKDIEILQKEYRVHALKLTLSKNPLLFTLGFLKILVISLVRIPFHHMVFIWFADYHSFLPILIAGIFKKKSFLVIGGYDVARIRELNYGSHVKGFRSCCARYSMQHATACLTVSKYTDRKVKYIAPRANRMLIPNGVSFDQPLGEQKRENMVLSVGVISSYKGFRVKGLDTFLAVAQQMPDTPFVFIGSDKEAIRRYAGNIPDNVSFPGKLPHEELASYFRKAKIYCQLSLSESFGLALAEAMYFGCYPVVCNHTALPEMVGNHGTVISCKKTDKLVSYIKDALANYQVNTRAREHILSSYTLDLRQEKLLSFLSS